MHEISLCEDIRTLLEEQALSQKFDRVTRIWLDIGPFSCVEPEALRFGFDAVMRGSVAEGAALEIDAPPGEARCLGCGATARVASRAEPCPECGLPGLHARGGDDLRIRKVEVI